MPYASARCVCELHDSTVALCLHCQRSQNLPDNVNIETMDDMYKPFCSFTDRARVTYSVFLRADRGNTISCGRLGVPKLPTTRWDSFMPYADEYYPFLWDQTYNIFSSDTLQTAHSSFRLDNELITKTTNHANTGTVIFFV